MLRESLRALGFERPDFVFFTLANRKGPHPGSAQILRKDLVDSAVALGAVAAFFAWIMAGVFDRVAISGPKLNAIELVNGGESIGFGAQGFELRLLEGNAHRFEVSQASGAFQLREVVAG